MTFTLTCFSYHELFFQMTDFIKKYTNIKPHDFLESHELLGKTGSSIKCTLASVTTIENIRPRCVVEELLIGDWTNAKYIFEKKCMFHSNKKINM